MKVAEINHNMVLPPIRPTALMSPNFATPTTNVENTNGAMIIFTSRRNMSVRIEMLSANFWIVASPFVPFPVERPIIYPAVLPRAILSAATCCPAFPPP
jgi:hypothetical protein